MPNLPHPHNYAFCLTQAGIGLPDRDYCLKREFAAQKTGYQNYVATLLNWRWSPPMTEAQPGLRMKLTQNTARQSVISSQLERSRNYLTLMPRGSSPPLGMTFMASRIL